MSRRLVSRRSFLTGIASAAAISYRVSFCAESSDTSSLSALPSGIEVVDYRLFRSRGVDRFLVEVFNSTGMAVDTPSLGIVLPHLGSDENFGWAIPMQEVLHPHSSAGLIGVAPSGIHSDEDWGSPEWIICNEVESTKAERISSWDLEIDHTLSILGNNDVLANITLTNHGKPLPITVTVLGLVRDGERRISGVTVPLYLNSIKPGETSELPVRFGPTLDYVANPKAMINTDEGVSVDFSFQPWPSEINPGCSPVMKWNR